MSIIFLLFFQSIHYCPKWPQMMHSFCWLLYDWHGHLQWSPTEVAPPFVWVYTGHNPPWHPLCYQGYPILDQKVCTNFFKLMVTCFMWSFTKISYTGDYLTIGVLRLWLGGSYRHFSLDMTVHVVRCIKVGYSSRDNTFNLHFLYVIQIFR